MRLLADEGVDSQIVERLRGDGHEVLYVAEMDPGISDESVLETAWRESVVILTADKDSGELVFRQGHSGSGVVLVRLQGLSAESKANMVAAAISEHSEELCGNFSVVSPGALRIRRRLS